MRRILVLLALVGVLVLAAACGDDGDEITIRGDEGEEITVSDDGDDGGEITITDEEGDVTFSSGGDLPDNFPDDFPIFEGADLVSAAEAQQDGNAGFAVVWETDAPADEVADFYKDALDRGPWHREGVFSAAGNTVIGVSRTDSEDFGGGVTISENGRTQIGVFIGEGEDFGVPPDFGE